MDDDVELILIAMALQTLLYALRAVRAVVEIELAALGFEQPRLPLERFVGVPR